MDEHTFKYKDTRTRAKEIRTLGEGLCAKGCPGADECGGQWCEHFRTELDEDLTGEHYKQCFDCLVITGAQRRGAEGG